MSTNTGDGALQVSHSFNKLDTRLSLAGNSLTIELTNSLTPSTLYTFTIPKDTFTLLAGNEEESKEDAKGNAKGNDEFSFTFTTADPGAPIDETLFSHSADTWYETESTDDGSFNQTLTITFPLEGVEPSSSLSGVFGTANALGNRAGDTSIPVTIDGLPDGLSVALTQTSTGVELDLTGNANAHTKKDDNTNFNLTFLSGFFDTSALYTSADISFSFDIVFGGKIRWSSRSYHQSFVYEDKIWVLGGQQNTIAGVQSQKPLNEIWTIKNKGSNSTEVSVTGSYWLTGRYLHQSFVYDNKIWILGGFDGDDSRKNDIWNSADGGVTWSEVSPINTYWSARSGHQAFVYDNKIWVLGGFDSGNKNDIWNSADGGVTWNEVSPNGTHWSARNTHQSFVYDDKIWVMGGEDDNGYTNDIWTSDDKGLNWVNVNAGSDWSGRSLFQALVHNDTLFVLGGSSGFLNEKNDIWSSTDKGTKWTQVPVTGTHWSVRDGLQAFVYDNKIWILGGFVTHNDIWTSADGGTNWQEVEEGFSY